MHTSISLFALVLTLANCRVALAKINPDQDKICQALLGVPAAEALREAVATGEYGFDLLTTTVDGRTRSVLLVGEHHNKSNAASVAGKALFAEFENIGLEGAPVGKLWGGKILERLIASAEASLKARGLSLSTIDDVRAADYTRTLKEVLAKSFVAAGFDDESVSKFGDFKLENGEQLTAGELLELVRALRSSGTARPSGPRIFELEDGHKIRLREKLGPIVLAGQVLGPLAACLGSICYLTYAALAAPEQLLPASLLAGLGALSTLTYKTKTSFFAGLFLGKPRDPTIAKNIARILTDHPEVDQLLVIAGNGHVPGISALLRENGFKSEATVQLSKK